MNAEDARIIRCYDFSSVLNILCAIKHYQVNQSMCWILLFENFNYHVCKISGIFLPAICQVLRSVNDVQDDRAIVRIVTNHCGKRQSVNGRTVGLNRNTKSFWI